MSYFLAYITVVSTQCQHKDKIEIWVKYSLGEGDWSILIVKCCLVLDPPIL